MKNKQKIILLSLLIGLIISAPITLSLGAESIAISDILSVLFHHFGFSDQTDVSQQHDAIIWVIRFPRIIMALAIGGALAVTGAAMQGLLRNPLADPSIIGISSGGALTAAITIVLFPSLLISGSWIGVSILSFMTFIGVIGVTILIFSLATHKGKIDVLYLLLSGIAINAIAWAGTGFLNFVADDQQLRSLTFWTMGSLSGSNYTNSLMMMAISVVSLIVFYSFYKGLNALVLGESQAKHLGIPVEKLKWIIIIFTALCVGTAVSFTGMIGFVGLVIPHIFRLWAGADYRFLIPASFFGGSLLMLWADTFSRVVVAPVELPIGIVTAFIGAPAFIYLILKQRKSKYAGV